MDDPLPAVWDEHTWICIGKRYPSSNTPDFILAERSKILQIPSVYIANIPNKRLSIADLLKCPLPPQTIVRISQKGTISFAYCPVHQHFHSTAIHLTSTKILFGFSRSLGARKSKYIQRCEHWWLRGKREGKIFVVLVLLVGVRQVVQMEISLSQC